VSALPWTISNGRGDTAQTLLAPEGLRRQRNHALNVGTGGAGGDHHRSPKGVADDHDRGVSLPFEVGGSGQQVKGAFVQVVGHPVVQPQRGYPPCCRTPRPGVNRCRALGLRSRPGRRIPKPLPRWPQHSGEGCRGCLRGWCAEASPRLFGRREPVPEEPPRESNRRP